MLVAYLLLSVDEVNDINNSKNYIDSLDQLHEDLQIWEAKGFYTTILGHRVFGVDFVPEMQHHAAGGDGDVTFILLHGFPSSSHEYSYGAAESLRDLGYNVMLHDHVGFGFSDKPFQGFGYSIHDHADVALAYWRQRGVSGRCIIVGHDMGDSILTEILARYERDRTVLPPGMQLEQVCNWDLTQYGIFK